MKLKWTRRALEQLVEAQDYIAQENPQAARQVGERIADASRLLLTQPGIGHRGRVAGTLEWVVRRTPYFLVYKLEDDWLIVLRVIHSKQQWP
ncbi:MAG: type II toxin-antitoxin system RelE/ParE family toxin [Wenzhouxiangella sp.]